jgi:hypothetical protein
LWVFLWTWLLHSWQAFWLLGEFPFRWQDGVLWLGVGAVVAANAVIDFRRASRSTTPTAFSFFRAAQRSVQVVCVFCCVCLFWAHWANPDVFQMLIYSAGMMPVTAADAAILAGIAVGAIVIGVAVQYAVRRPALQRFRMERLAFETSVAWHLAPLVLLLLVTQPPVSERFGSNTAKFLAGMQVERLSRGEALAMIDGYYEELNEKSLQSGPFLRDPVPRRSSQAVDFGDMIQQRGDLLEHELIPNWKGTWWGATISVNRWGMRDRDRSLVKPAGTVRIAVVGSSLVMGFGVGDDQTFTRLLEDRLNADAAPGGPRYEVLNFGVGRYSPLHRRLQIEHKVLPFRPDLIVYFAHQDELYTSAKRLGPAAYHGLDLEDSCLEAIVRGAGIEDRSSSAMLQLRIEQHPAEILDCVYRGMAEAGRSIDASLLYVYLPIPGDHDLPFDPRLCLPMAQAAGLEAMDLSGWEGDREPAEVLLNSLDHHANALGHRLLADALEPLLRERLGIGRRPAASPPR